MTTTLDTGEKLSLPEQIAWLKGCMGSQKCEEDQRMVQSIIDALWPTDEQERARWDEAIKAAIDQCWRLEHKGKDDHRQSWMGNAVAAITKLYAPDLTKDSEY